ncbi:MAG: hypothetical protein RR336_08950, partial [Oscillospiraceae bacterium]
MATKMKKTLSLALALIMVLGMLPLSAMAEEETSSAPNNCKENYTVFLTIIDNDEYLVEEGMVGVKIYNADGLIFNESVQTVSSIAINALTDASKPERIEVAYKGATVELTGEDLIRINGCDDVDTYYLKDVYFNTTVTPPPVSNITEADQQLLDSLGDNTIQSFNVYSYYSPTIPDEIHKDFNAGLFGPSKNDIPYFTVDVNMEQLLNIDGMNTHWEGSQWFVSVDSCKLEGETRPEKLEKYWETVKSAMSAADVTKIETNFNG